MTNSEFNQLINESSNAEWLNSYETTITFDSIKETQKFKGFSPLSIYLNQQIDGFKQLGEVLPRELGLSKNYFRQYRDIIDAIISVDTNLAQPQALSQMQSHVRNAPKINYTVFPYDCAETGFLLTLFRKEQGLYDGAFKFLTGNIEGGGFTKAILTGYMLAYEFQMKEQSDIVLRRVDEKKSLSSLKSDFKRYVSESEQHLKDLRDDHLKKSKEQIDKLIAQTQEQKTSFDSWFIFLQNDSWPRWFDASKSNIDLLEKTYSENLKLKEPAKYWSDRAKSLKNQGWWAFGFLSFFVVAACISLGIVLWTAPDQIYLSWFGGDKSAAIRWTLVYITLLSFLAFAIKVITKFMMSSFHIARDNEERHALTYFYLSLLKDTAVNDNDRQLIMQSLFSRSETGLLKDESAPTMPNDILGKFSQMGGKVG
jgi:hypothetical protein